MTERLIPPIDERVTFLPGIRQEIFKHKTGYLNAEHVEHNIPLLEIPLEFESITGEILLIPITNLASHKQYLNFTPLGDVQEIIQTSNGIPKYKQTPIGLRFFLHAKSLEELHRIRDQQITIFAGQEKFTIRTADPYSAREAFNALRKGIPDAFVRSGIPQDELNDPGEILLPWDEGKIATIEIGIDYLHLEQDDD